MMTCLSLPQEAIYHTQIHRQAERPERSSVWCKRSSRHRRLTNWIGLSFAKPTLGIDGGVRGEVSDGFRGELVSRN